MRNCAFANPDDLERLVRKLTEGAESDHETQVLLGAATAEGTRKLQSAAIGQVRGATTPKLQRQRQRGAQLQRCSSPHLRQQLVTWTKMLDWCQSHGAALLDRSAPLAK